MHRVRASSGHRRNPACSC